jgi:6-pyruvoyltetrahydropterin/6-carboxytetrahydropterin synthase
MYELTTEASFSAAHHLRNYDGPCENVHGHNWLVRITVQCEELNEIGIGVDFGILRQKLREVVGQLDHSDLNAIFDEHHGNPSSELIARHIFYCMKLALAVLPCTVHRVEVFETPGNSATYLE